MHFEKKFDFDALFRAVNSLPDSTQLDLFGLQAAKNSLQGILKIAQVLQTHFDVVATNPPYLNRMNGDLKKYVKKYYKAYSGDLFSVFIWKNIEMTKQDGYSAYMTPFVWMFIKTYEGLRKSILDSKQISSLIQMEYSAFEEATVPINTFVLKNDMSADSTGTYLKLSDFKGGMEVQRRYVLKAVADPSVSYLYRTKQTNFEKIPGSPIAYWASNNLIRSFEIGTPLKDLVQPKVGLQTGDNNRFLRQWYEVEPFRISFTSTSTEDALKSGEKWFPYNKGGSYRKWYGNYDYVVNWQDDGYEIKHFVDFNGKVRSRPQNTDYYFREAITWSDVTSGHFSMRYRKEGSIFDVVGMSLFSSDTKRLLQILLFSNTKVMNYIMSFLNPTIHASIGYVSLTPIIFTENTAAFDLANQCLANTEKDWNSYENSWSFQKIPLLDNIADHQKSPPTKLLIFFDFCDKYVPIQFRGLIFYGKLSKKR
ncbi:Type IIS restriction enzyme Eco57I [Lacticaseibacillus paracasei]|nr:Type IIS restriction enzyme Eco57I [Lacticaseibacillus paracasei]